MQAVLSQEVTSTNFWGGETSSFLELSYLILFLVAFSIGTF